MMRFVVAALLACGWIGCGGGTDDPPDLGPSPPKSTTIDGEGLNPRLLRRFKPLRSASAPDPAIVTLGKMLFFDARLSRNGNVSCNSCHALDRGGSGTDGRATSLGTAGKAGKRNAPTVLNAAWHVAQFWDGRSPDLEHQALGPILDPEEMAMQDPAAVTAMLQSIPGYVTAFEAAFPGEPIDLPHAARAIAAFETTLLTPSRWDRFLRGAHTALTRAEKDGVKLFADLGCVQCHSGELVGGSMFQKVGVTRAWPNQADQGRFELTHQDGDRMVFKVPSLRNVAITGPYFHDGSVADLSTAVQMMGRHQLGIEVTEDEIASLVAWLGSLTGDHPTIVAPLLP